MKGVAAINKTIFSSHSSLGLRAIFFALLAGVLLLLHVLHVSWVSSLRSTLGVVVYPIQYLVSAPIEAADWLIHRVGSERRLMNENAQLRAHGFLLQSKVQRLLALEKENVELRKLLKSSAHVGQKVSVAKLLAVDLSPGLQQVVLNKGGKEHVQVGQSVLDAHGVLGQVVRVGVLTSKVLLLTDSRSAIPVLNDRSQVRSIALGQGVPERLSLLHVQKNTDVRAGDLYVSAGLAGRYPAGYPVGRVVSVKMPVDDQFLKVLLKPTARLDRTRQVLLVWSKNQKLAAAVSRQLKAGVPD